MCWDIQMFLPQCCDETAIHHHEVARARHELRVRTMNVALEMYELKITAVVLFRRGVYGYSTRENSANQERTSEKIYKVQEKGNQH